MDFLSYMKSYSIWYEHQFVMINYAKEYHAIKPRANGRKVVGQQLLTSLDVTCCVHGRSQLFD